MPQLGLEQNFYEVSESNGPLEVCVEASFPDGSQSSVAVTISTSPLSALGKTNYSQSYVTRVKVTCCIINVFCRSRRLRRLL